MPKVQVWVVIAASCGEYAKGPYLGLFWVWAEDFTEAAEPRPFQWQHASLVALVGMTCDLSLQSLRWSLLHTFSNFFETCEVLWQQRCSQPLTRSFPFRTIPANQTNKRGTVELGTWRHIPILQRRFGNDFQKNALKGDFPRITSTQKRNRPLRLACHNMSHALHAWTAQLVGHPTKGSWQHDPNDPSTPWELHKGLAWSSI